MASVLVVGGAGYIGSHMMRLLTDAGHEAIAFDNLSNGHSDAVDTNRLVIGELSNLEDIKNLFENYAFDAVMHFASNIEVSESVQNPQKYYQNNVINTINLIDSMVSFNIKNLVFSSSAAVYGATNSTPINEQSEILPTSPYGKTKAIIEGLLSDYHEAYGLNSISLRYFNAAGADPKNGLGERHNPETHLIPLAIQAAFSESKNFTIFGNDYPTEDGTCVRDFVHVLDLCTAHLRAMNVLITSKKINEKINLGNGKGFSVRQVLAEVEKISGNSIEIIEGAQRKGDPPILIADTAHANSYLNWQPIHSSLEEIVATAWEFHKQKKFEEHL